MKQFTTFITALFISFTMSLSAENALTPDFAYPKTVKANADTLLKRAIKANDGPAVVDALIQWSLAQTRISPDADVASKMRSVREQVTDSATKGVIDLLIADACPESLDAYDAMVRYASAFRQCPVAPWSGVINARPQFFPSLYHVAAAMALKGSHEQQILATMRQYTQHDPLASLYWIMAGCDDASQLTAKADSLINLPESAFLLMHAGEIASDIPQRKDIYDLSQKWIALHPSSSYRRDIEGSLIPYVCRPSVEISADNLVMRGQKAKVKIHAVCTPQVTVTCTPRKGGDGHVSTRSVSFDGSGVFVRDTVVEFDMNSYGVYAISTTSPQIQKKGRNCIEVAVTDIMLQRRAFGRDGKVYALSAANGRELTDAQFSYTDNRISASLGSDRWTPAIWNFNRANTPIDSAINANILIDRSIYRPGDTVRLCVVAICSSPGQSHTAADVSLDVELRDANFQPLDTVTVTTDSFGRAMAQFVLPQDGLAGTFWLRALQSDHVCGSQNFTVAEYKAPTFEVAANAERLSDSCCKVSGKAVGYNGFPIADASVSLKVITLPRWSWWGNYRVSPGWLIAQAEAVTSDDGSFSSDIQLPECDEPMRVEVVVGSPTGETQQEYAFVPARPYFIDVDLNTYVTPSSLPSIKIVDSASSTSNVPFIVELFNDSCRLTPDGDWSNIPSGRYRLKVCPEEPAFALPYESEPFYFYRPCDKMPPATLALFVPETTVNHGGKLLVGTSYDDQYILCTLSDGQHVLSSRWLPVGCGNRYIDVSLPDGVDKAELTLSTMRNFSPAVKKVNVVRPNIPTTLKVEFTSMRDKTVPGQREHWTLRVADNLGQTVPVAVVFDVYSKALDALRPHALRFNPFIDSGFNFNVESYWFGAERDWLNSWPSFENRLDISAPGFNLYGQSWPGILHLRYGSLKLGAYMMKSMATVESADDCEAVEECADTAAGMINGEYKNDAPLSDCDGGASVSDAQLRMPEVPLALWQPMLTTDSDGQLSVEFDTPQANTTWRVLCLAFSQDALFGNAASQVIAAKPLMVQPQWPRMARVGDRFSLSASVMNASDTTMTAQSRIELFNPVTRETIATFTQTDTIPSGGSVLLSAPVEVGDVTMLGARVIASADGFTDGEQNIIPILPAVISQRQAVPFFISADSTHFSLNLPQGSVVNLISNAVWECVTALPGLSALQGTDALTSATALFSAAVARGLLHDYPQIGSAMSQWQQNDSTLTSALSQNEDLKIALLQSTPWVGAAQSDTERMMRLKLLLDPKQTDQAIRSSVENLSKLMHNGGFSWSPLAEQPSLWITETVLSLMAQLKAMGYLPQNRKLLTMLSSNVGYLDSEIDRIYKDNKKATDADYCYIRRIFSSKPMPLAGAKVCQNTVNDFISNWRKMSLNGKAQAALTLEASGHHATALSIIESLRQYEAWHQTGLSPELLDAFAAIQPKCAEVDVIRQQFISLKQSMMWGEGVPTARLVASLLRSGSNWLVPADGQIRATLNDTTIDIHADQFLGDITISAPKGGTLAVTKGQFPSWGGVFSCVTDSATSINASSSQSLAVTRRIEGDLKVGSKVKMIIEIEAQQPIDFLLVQSPRCGALEPSSQLPSRLWLGWQAVYREPCATQTNWYFDRLLPGKTIIEEEMFITMNGEFMFAPVQAQSQYAPEFHANSSGSQIVIKK